MPAKRISANRDLPVEHLNIHPQYIKALHAAGIRRIRDFENWSMDRLAAHGVGPAGQAILRHQLAYYGYEIDAPSGGIQRKTAEVSSDPV